MKSIWKNTQQPSETYSPKTEQKRNEAFRLLDELERELARKQALRAVLKELSDPQDSW
jgi:hypothetical protein